MGMAAGLSWGQSDDHGNDAGSATPVGMDSATPGRIGETSGRDVDWFRIDVGRDGRLSVGTTGSLDTVGTLYLADGTTVAAEDDDSGEGYNFLIEADVRAGVHYVEVRGWGEGDTGPYTLVVGNPAAGGGPPRSVPLVTAASRAAQQGFLRVINRSESAGTVSVNPIDDAGASAGPVTLSLDPRAARQFNSQDLESGNAGKGLSGGVGHGRGDWRVAFPTDLDILPLAYIRTPDGFLTSVHDTVPQANGSHYVAIFNPASNYRQRSLLRLINPGGEDAEVTIDGLDDAGDPPPGGPVRLSLPAGRSTTVSAEQLENGGPGLRGAFGDGAGKWRLFVTSSAPIRGMSLMDTPTGNLTNLSTLGLGAVGWVAGDGTTAYGIPLVTSASRAAQQGFLRIINLSDRTGTVRIHAVDDAGNRAGPVTLSLGARAAQQFNSGDLEFGNADKGLSGGVGGGHGDWRLELSTDLDILPLAYIRTPDGFLTSVHDRAPEADGSHYVAIFNPASNYRQRSLLRLVNPGGESAEVTIDGLDDAGAAPSGGPVRLSLPAGQSTTVSAEQLEDGGPGLRGAFGDGAGKWRLFVTTSVPIHVMSLMDTPTGNLTNLSTLGPLDRRSGAPLLAPGAAADGSLDGPGDEDHWRIDVPSRGRVVIETAGGTDTVGRLEDASGRILAEDDNGGAGGNFRIELDLDPGTYYLRLSGSGDSAGDYRLSFHHAPESSGATFSAKHAITTEVTRSVHAADLDGDGDADVLSASRFDGRIAWRENDGNGEFSAPRTITMDAEGTEDGALHAVDMDGDGDADVVSGSWIDDRIAWYENMGGGDFSAQRVIAAGSVVHPADLDGDGDADLLSAGSAVEWRENLGGGDFSAPRMIASSRDGDYFVSRLHAADLDGDGDMDVLSAWWWEDPAGDFLEGDGRIAWYENLGGGAFSQSRVIATPAGPSAVSVADLDGDGDGDVLFTSRYDQTVEWQENLGNGTFSEPRPIGTGSWALSVHAADLDGDGDADVLVTLMGGADRDRGLAWHENLGAGRFSQRRMIERGPGRHLDTTVQTADMDGDGDFDVLSVLTGIGVWHENLSDHGDDHRDTADEAMLVTALPAFLHGTLESAGDRDLFRIATGSGTLRAYSNGPTDTFGRLLDGTGAVLASNDDGGVRANFHAETVVEAGVHYVEVSGFAGQATGPYTLSIEFVADGGVAAPDAPTALAASPGDGEATLTWTASPDDGGSAVLRHEYRLRTGGGAYGSWISIPDSAPSGTNALGYTVTGLANGDRAFFQVRTVNAVGPSEPSNETDATPRTVGGSGVVFSAERVIATDAFRAESVHAADLDGDGDADVLSASYSDGRIAWHENEGGGAFSMPRAIATDAYGARSVHAADLDGDGDADVLSASESDDKIAWYENEGGGAFSAARTIAADADGAQSVYAADLDGDGDADVLSASYNDGQISWHENEGGVFLERVISTDAPGARFVRAVDLDGDGDADVLSATRNDDKVAWYENEGGGAFSAARIIATDADGAWSVHAADLDGDGDADVLSASRDNDKVAWYENEGNGVFSATRTIATNVYDTTSVHAADLDGDGDADVLSVSYDDGKISWNENEGGGAFSAPRSIAADADGPTSVHAADLDGDGDADVLFASWWGDRIAWYENQSDHGDDHRDTVGGATLVTALPAFMHGTLESAGDRDVFRIATGSGTLRAYSNGPTDTVGRLLDGNGEELASNDDTLAGTNFRIETTVAPGVHYVEVSQFSFFDTGAYTLSIEFVADGGGGVAAVPDSPTGLSASPGDGEVTLSWTASVDDASSAALRHEYRDRTRDGAYGGWTAIPDSAPGGANALGYTVTDLANGERAFFQVRAVNEVGASEPSNEVDVTPLADDVPPDFAMHLIDSPVLSLNVDDIHGVDIDGDGDLDVLTSGANADLAWHENVGGVFTQRLIVDRGNFHLFAHPVDFDGDGDADVLVAVWSHTAEDEDKIAWHENNGRGVFEERVIAPNVHQPRSAHAADLDGDGDLDVLFASRDDDKVAWYENDGRVFEEHVISTDLSDATMVQAADLDGDGDADVLAASGSNYSFSWYENDGRGVFEERVISTRHIRVRFMQVADLDADGDADIVFSNSFNNHLSTGIAWYENDGSGVFTGRLIISTDPAPWHGQVTDLDGDGDVDVLSAFDAQVAWYENEGGVFAERVISTDDRFSGVGAADLDGDGDDDVLSTSTTDHQLVWYENQSDQGDDHRDTVGGATLVTALPAFLHGTLESAGDRDVFRIATGSGTLRAYSNGPADTFGRLLDRNGVELSSNDDVGAGTNFDVETDVEAGVHYVEVSGSGTATGPYTLSIEFVADADD